MKKILVCVAGIAAVAYLLKKFSNCFDSDIDEQSRLVEKHLYEMD